MAHIFVHNHIQEYLAQLRPRSSQTREVCDVRLIYRNQQLYTPNIRQSLQQVIQQNKSTWSGIFDK